MAVIRQGFESALRHRVDRKWRRQGLDVQLLYIGGGAVVTVVIVGAVWVIGTWMLISGGGMNGGGGAASLGGGGGGVSGGGFLISSMILVSIGAFSTSTTLRARPVTSAHPSSR